MATTVESEKELVQVSLDVFHTDPMMNSQESRFEVSENFVNMGSQLSSPLLDGKKFRSLMPFLFFLATAAWGTPAESFQDLMAKAREAQLAGKSDQAADLYRAALRLRPHWGPAEY